MTWGILQSKLDRGNEDLKLALANGIHAFGAKYSLDSDGDVC